MDCKNVNEPDETRQFAGHGHADVLTVGGHTVLSGTFEPGWRWSNDVKPVAGTDLCEVEHLLYVEEGRMVVEFPDQDDVEIGPGDVVHIEPGHDAHVVGSKAVVSLDFGPSVSTYAK